MHKASILIVDDEPTNIRLLTEVLKDRHDIRVATSGHQALSILDQHSTDIDLILLDVSMPEMSGMEVLVKIKKNNSLVDIPVIFVTASKQECDEEQGLVLGAVDYITKPISAPIVRARIETHLNLRRAKLALAEQNQILEEKVKQRTEEISTTQDVVVFALTSLAETRDNETGGHIVRTQHYVRHLAELIRDMPEYRDELDDSIIEALFKTAPLHDVGKVGIPDSVLLKPGKLNDEEWEIMRTHTTLGGDALEKAMASVQGRGVQFMKYALEIAYSHHEKWDGSGYPKGLTGNDIPLSARLMAIADVYDALISKRCYKDAFSHEKAISIMEEGKGQHFDPKMISVFLEHESEFHKIAMTYRDE